MKQYIVDAFTDKIFAGNQAAVCVMDDCPVEDLMVNIAVENNFSETAFLVKEKDGAYGLRMVIGSPWNRGDAIIDDILFVVYTERTKIEVKGASIDIIRLISARMATSFERGVYYGKC